MRHLLASVTTLALLSVSGSAVAAQEASPEPGASPTPEQLAAAEDLLASGEAGECFGKPATIVAIAGFETTGTPGADVIVGTEGDDIIRGEGGNDRICAGDGADLVEGGDGKDRIEGGAGDDQLDGGAGNDTVNGGKGADMVTGAAGNDRLSGAAGDDTLDGGKGNDVCAGGPDHDWLPGCNDKRRTKGTLVIHKNTTLKGPHRGRIIIAADKVTLDCDGHTVRGPGAEIGISLRDRRTGATVKNCEVTNFSEGIDVGNGARRNTITRNYVHHNSLIGIGLQDANGNKVTRNTVDRNGFGREETWGILVQPTSSGNVIDRNTASDNGGDNIEVGWRTSRNRVSNNTTTGGMFGIDIGGSRQRVENNIVRDAFAHGMGGGEETKRSVFVGNSVTGTISGAAYRLGGSGNTIRRNVATENENVGFEDRSVPGANTYINNVCVSNAGLGSEPEGLCADELSLLDEPDTSSALTGQDILIAFDQDQAALDGRLDLVEVRTAPRGFMEVDATCFGTAGRYPSYDTYIHDRSSKQKGLVEEAIGFDVYPTGARVRDLEYTGVMCEVDGASEHYKVYSGIAD